MAHDDPVETASINVHGTVNVFEAARKRKAAKVVYAESSAMYEGSAVMPTDLGSGGASDGSSVYHGGRGGGAIRLDMTGTLTLDGTISANGFSIISWRTNRPPNRRRWIVSANSAISRTIN